MSVEEVFVEHWVVIGEGLRQAGESGGRDLLERRLVGFKPDPTHIQVNPILAVHAG